MREERRGEAGVTDEEPLSNKGGDAGLAGAALVIGRRGARLDV